MARRMTREQYDTLVAAGAYDEQRVELLEGVVVEMPPEGPAHANAVSRTSNRLVLRLAHAFGERYLVRVQNPVAASDLSEPEPDITVVDTAASTDTAHPATAHLVVEVAQTSHRRDLGVKARVYAGSGVPQYWVLDLVRRQVVVHTGPRAGDEAVDVPPGYGSVQHLPLDTELDVLGLRLRPADLM